MTRGPNEKAVEAEKLYRTGMKLVEIADKLEVPAGTVRRWKSTYHWDGEKNEQKKSERSDKKKANVRNKNGQIKQVVADEVKEVIQNMDLTDKQQLFCVYYVQCRNQAKAYQKAYKCSRENAYGHASALWKKVEIQKEIDRLLEEYRSDVGVDIKDLFRWYLDIARADINDFVEISDFGLKVRKEIDGTLVSEISETTNGVKVKLNDRMKAMEWLDDHIGLADEKQRAEIALLKSKANVGKDDKEEKLDKFFEKIEGVLKDAE